MRCRGEKRRGEGGREGEVGLSGNEAAVELQELSLQEVSRQSILSEET